VIEAHVDKLIKDGNEQIISNTCYAIAILGMSKKHNTLLKQLWSTAIFLTDLDNVFDASIFVQLAQTQLFAEADGVVLPSPSEKIMERINQASGNRDENEQSRSSKEISLLLKEIGFKHNVEVAPHASVSGGMLAIDFACPDRSIAIEFDGPSHYLKALRTDNFTSIENGPTKAKRKYLQQLGWIVINLDYRDYTKVKQDGNAMQWIRRKLEDEGISLSKTL